MGRGGGGDKQGQDRGGFGERGNSEKQEEKKKGRGTIAKFVQDFAHQFHTLLPVHTKKQSESLVSIFMVKISFYVILSSFISFLIW